MGDIKTLPPRLQGVATKSYTPYVNPKDASIEAQVAVYAIAEVQAAGKELPKDLIDAKDAWCRHALRNFVGVNK